MGDDYTVEQFMRFALYHPEVGYYARHVRGIGRRGDFATAPALSPILGTAMARWAVSLPGNGCVFRPWYIIEIGAGDGSMARHILKCLGPRARARLTYHIVETSQPLQQAQRERLAGGRFRWHSEMDAALAACKGRATVIANELIDAFPATQWVWSAGRWREAGVRLTDGKPVEILLEPDIARARRWCPDKTMCLGPRRDGDRFEMHLSYAEWFTAWVPKLTAGAILLIDYGAEGIAPRPAGSIRAFWHHQTVRGTGVFLRPGRQDLTADVDLADVRRWGELSGLRTESSTPLATFIGRWVPEGAPDPAAASLMDTAGAGGAFKVLDQRRAVAP